MLGERQGLQGSVKGTSGPGDLALVHEELAVVQPYPGHLRGESGGRSGGEREREGGQEGRGGKEERDGKGREGGEGWEGEGVR